MEYKTISAHDVLNLAWGALLERQQREIDRKKDLNMRGKASPIADAKIEKYEAQIREIGAALLAMEREMEEEQ